MKRQFSEFLTDCNNGAFSSDCTDRLEELVKAIEEHQRGGSITISVNITPNEDGTASVSASCTIKKPTKRRGPSIFFVHQDGLHREHPNQLKMFESSDKVRSIEEKKKNVRDI